MKKHTVSQQQLLMMAQASIARLGNFIDLNRPIVLKFSNAKSYFGKYETELIVADTIEIVHIITISCVYNHSQSVMDATMGHEMVHAKQIECGDEADHGPTYEVWREEIRANFGLDIDE